MGDLGYKFRKTREQKGFSLDDVSNVTKIGTRMLQAIEDERFDQLPGGIFNKGFIRAYAKHLDMNDDDAVNEYLACLRQAQVNSPDIWEPEQSSPPLTHDKRSASDSAATGRSGPADELPHLQLPRAEHVRPPRRQGLANDDGGIPWRILAVSALVIVLGITLWIRRSHRSHSAATPIAVAPVAATQTTPNAAPTPSPQTPVRKNAPVATSLSGSAPSSSPKSTASTGQTPAKSAADKEKPTQLNLVIRANENSWVSITADGQSLRHETLIAPANTSVHASREIVAKVGNAAGVSFLFNGREIPAQGAESEVKTLVFDSSGVRVATPPTPAPADQVQ